MGRNGRDLRSIDGWMSRDGGRRMRGKCVRWRRQRRGKGRLGRLMRRIGGKRNGRKGGEVRRESGRDWMLIKHVGV